MMSNLKLSFLLGVILLNNAHAMEAPQMPITSSVDFSQGQAVQQSDKMLPIRQAYDTYQQNPNPDLRLEITLQLGNLLNNKEITPTNQAEALSIAQALNHPDLVNRLTNYTGEYEKSFPFQEQPREMINEIMGHYGRQTLSRYSQVDKNTYHSVHSPNENGFRNPISEKILNLQESQSFNLEQPGEEERLISFLHYTQTQDRWVDVEIVWNDENNQDWIIKILPLCTNIRFIHYKTKYERGDNSFKLTPLISAIIFKKPEIIHSLISHMQKINPVRFQEYINIKSLYGGATALEQAIQFEMQDIVLLLISVGAKLDTAEDIKGHTPLILATYHGLTDIVKVIINKMRENNPASLQQYLNYMDQDNKTALMIAQEKGYSDIVTILQQADVTTITPFIQTLLGWVVRYPAYSWVFEGNYK